MNNQINFSSKKIPPYLNHSSILKFSRFFKIKTTTYDKVFYYYNFNIPISLYAQKVFILLEIQVNASLIRIKLVPYSYIVNELCFYRVIHINKQFISSPFYLLSLYDTVAIPINLHNYLYYRHYRIQKYPKQLAIFFKEYWSHFTSFNQNKIWLLNNYLLSSITAQAFIFDYPNIILYIHVFKRFTSLYYKNRAYPLLENSLDNKSKKYLKDKSHNLEGTYDVIKLKLFTYASFYK